MSVLQNPERICCNDVQMWDNAAFDNGVDLETSTNIGLDYPWSNNYSSKIFSNQSFESDCTHKENVNPSFFESQSTKHLRVNSVVGNGIPKSVSKTGVLEDRNLDFEIEEIEREINRLSSKLVELRLQKVKRKAKMIEKRGRIVAAKFMDPPKEALRSNEERKIEESTNTSGKLKAPRRGMSLGPVEIMKGMRRGISLGPAEIYSATKSKQFGSRNEITPIQSSANRRKSCYWKLGDIDELRVAKQRGKSMSVSPKSRSKTVNKPQIPKQAVTTTVAKKTVRKEDGVVSLMQPKKLFVKDGEKSGNCKNPIKGGRVVPSRYNQITASGGSSALKELRKRSWPENEEESKKSEKKRVSLAVKAEVIPRGSVKRVSELVVKKPILVEKNDSVCQVLKVEEGQNTKEYPKLRVLGSIDESLRNSGAVKRASQLVGRKPFFAADDEAEAEAEEMPGFSFNEDGNCIEMEDVLV